MTSNSDWYSAIDTMLDHIVGKATILGDAKDNAENLNAFGVVCDWVAHRLIDAGKDSDSQICAARGIARRTFQQAAYLGETVLDYHYDNDWLKEYRND